MTEVQLMIIATCFGFTFPIPRNALVVSQWVNACRAICAVQYSLVRPFANSVALNKLLVVSYSSVKQDGDGKGEHEMEKDEQYITVWSTFLDILIPLFFCIFTVHIYYCQSVMSVLNMIKALGRQRKVCIEKLIIRVEMTKRSLDWKGFLINDKW